MQRYHFAETGTIEAPADVVWRAIVEPGLPRWSRGVRRMDVRGGGPLGQGSVLDTTVKGRLPFTLSFTLVVRNFSARSRIEVESFGDLVGSGSWQLIDHGPATTVIYTWDVGLANPLLDGLGRIPWVKHLLRANHDRLMSEAFRTMTTELESANAVTRRDQDSR